MADAEACSEVFSLLERLKSGEKVLCKICKKGYYTPYNTTADKAQYFNCSNPECNNYYHWDPVINLE